jgi:hypothetical protein
MPAYNPYLNNPPYPYSIQPAPMIPMMPMMGGGGGLTLAQHGGGMFNFQLTTPSMIFFNVFLIFQLELLKLFYLLSLLLLLLLLLFFSF